MSDSTTLTGQVLHDTYLVKELITSRERGALYRALNVITNAPCSVKVLSSRLLPNPEAVARFKREAMVAYKLGHPHIVQVYDLNVTQLGVPYIVMEVLEGEHLAQKLQRTPRLGLDEVVAILEQTCGALQQAHDRGVIHRDLKAENIFLSTRVGKEANFVKVMNFGSAKLTKSLLQLTRTHSMIGTPGYMAPEQVRGQAAQVDHQADIFSMGVILYEMLTGAAPFGDGGVEEVFRRIAFEDPVPPSTVCLDLPSGIDQTVLTAMAKAPEARHPSMTELVTRFKAALGAHETVTGSSQTVEWDVAARQTVRARQAQVETETAEKTLVQIDRSAPETAAETLVKAEPSAPRHLPSDGDAAPGPSRPVSRGAIMILVLATLVVSTGLAYGIWAAFIRSPTTPQPVARRLALPAADLMASPASPPDLEPRRPGPDLASDRQPDAGLEPTPKRQRPPRRLKLKRGPGRARRAGHGFLTVVAIYGEDDFWAHIYLDDKYLGRSVIYKRRARAGAHVVRAKRLGYKTATKRFHLKAGQSRRIVLRLK